jgi:hypothetical protein
VRFEFGELAADGGQGQVQASPGGGQAAAVRDCGKDGHGVKAVHCSGFRDKDSRCDSLVAKNGSIYSFFHHNTPPQPACPGVIDMSSPPLSPFTPESAAGTMRLALDAQALLRTPMVGTAGLSIAGAERLLLRSYGERPVIRAGLPAVGL